MFSAALLNVSVGHTLPLLLDAAVKSLLVSAATLTALVCLRRASAATRHLVLLAGLGILLGLPVLMALLPQWVLPLPVGATGKAVATGLNSRVIKVQAPAYAGEEHTIRNPMPAKAGIRSTTARGFSPVKPVAEPATTQATSPAPPVRPAWLVLGWLAGVLLCMGRMLTAQSRVWRLTHRCPPLPPSLLPTTDIETECFTALLTGPTGTPPMVWGWPRAILLLPPEAADWPAARLRAVVLHEAAHVRRQDWLTQTLTHAICALYWFNPLVWLLAARLGAEAERACDDAVLLTGVPPTDYAQDLLAIARHLGAGHAQRRASVGAVTMARRSPVRGRLEAILDARRVRRCLTRRAAALALAAAFAVAAPLAILRPAARADERQSGQAAPTAGVPTETDIAKVQQHLKTLERDKLVYAWSRSQPNMLTTAQTAEVGYLIQQRERKRGYERFGPQGPADYARLQAEAKKPHTREERKRIWWAIFDYEHRPANVVKRQHDFNVFLARLQSNVDALPAEQVALETKMYRSDKAIALDKTQMERMQMERNLGYPLHINPEDFVDTARWGLESEKSGEMTRANRVHLYLLNAKVMQRHPLTDSDLDSALAILCAPSTHPGEAHAYVIGVLLDARTTIIAQQQKIREAVRPLLTSPDILDRTYSKTVFRRYSESVPTPTGVAPRKPSGRDTGG